MATKTPPPPTPYSIESLGGGQTGTISGSATANAATQAAIAAALAPYINQMQAYANQVGATGRPVPGEMLHGMKVKPAPASSLNQGLNQIFDFIQNPQYRQQAEQGQSALAQSIGQLPGAL